MASQLGFNFTIVQGFQYGEINSTSGDWIGMVGMLHRNEAEIAVASLTPTRSRRQVVDFTPTFLNAE